MKLASSTAWMAAAATAVLSTTTTALDDSDKPSARKWAKKAGPFRGNNNNNNKVKAQQYFDQVEEAVPVPVTVMESSPSPSTSVSVSSPSKEEVMIYMPDQHGVMVHTSMDHVDVTTLSNTEKSFYEKAWMEVVEEIVATNGVNLEFTSPHIVDYAAPGQKLEHMRVIDHPGDAEEGNDRRKLDIYGQYAFHQNEGYMFNIYHFLDYYPRWEETEVPAYQQMLASLSRPEDYWPKYYAQRWDYWANALELETMAKYKAEMDYRNLDADALEPLEINHGEPACVPSKDWKKAYKCYYEKKFGRCTTIYDGMDATVKEEAEECIAAQTKALSRDRCPPEEFGYIPSRDIGPWCQMYRTYKSENHTFRQYIQSPVDPADVEPVTDIEAYWASLYQQYLNGGGRKLTEEDGQVREVLEDAGDMLCDKLRSGPFEAFAHVDNCSVEISF